jgi:putative redox protein
LQADQAERPPQVFTDVRIHHMIGGYDVDPAAVEEAIRLSEEKYCSVGAMVKQTAALHTTYEIVAEMGVENPQRSRPKFGSRL